MFINVHKKELTFKKVSAIINAFVRYRGVAQLVARSVRDAEVVGSIPVASTKNPKNGVSIFGFFLFMRYAAGIEGGSRFARAKRFALRNKGNEKLDGKGRR